MHTAFGLLLALTASLMLLIPSEVEAKIYKCVGGDGSVSYAQRPCAAAEQTSKILGDKSVRERFDCRVARAFSTHIAGEMKAGSTADDVFDQYGGVNSITPTSMSVINYVFSHKTNVDTSVQRISALSGARCDTGTYSRNLECEHFPPSFIEGKGGCSAAKGESPSIDYQRENELASEDDSRSNLIATRVDPASSGSNVRVSSDENYNVLATSASDKQNECRVTIREQIGALQDRMRGRLSMEEHERLGEERSSLRDSYESC